MELLESYEVAENKLPIDHLYYIEKKFQKPIDQLLNIGYGDTIAKINESEYNIMYKPTSRHKAVGLDKLIDIVFKMLKYKCDNAIDILYDALYTVNEKLGLL